MALCLGKPEDPIIERAKERYKQVQKIMADAAKVRQEYYDLEAFLRQAHNLFPDAFEQWPLPEIMSPESVAAVPAAAGTFSVTEPVGLDSQPEKPEGELRTSDFAAWVLKVYGPLHIREILKRMQEEGWSGNKDEKTAEKSLYNALAAQKSRFRNTGRNVWTLIGDVLVETDRRMVKEN